MSEYQFAQLLADLAEIDQETSDIEPEVFDFSDDFSDDFSVIYQERGEA